MLHQINLKKSHIILTCKDIVILPFEGQNEPVAVAVQKKQQPKAPVKPATTNTGAFNAPPRPQISQPTGKLSTNNIGINATLNPVDRKIAGSIEPVNIELREDFTLEQLEHVWKEYSLIVKRNRKDSLYATLVKSKMMVSSDYQIHLELLNILQEKEIEAEKTEMLSFLRSKLRNAAIGLKCTIVESEKVEILDSKGIFDKMAEENASLNKFRKLFNLDIEF